jgi:hypothetical protein
MSNICEVINTKTIEYKVYQMMETAMIVSETFANLNHKELLSEDHVYGESESDTYATLTAYALEIEKQNTEDNPLYVEDIREKAEEMILKDYGKPSTKKYSVQRGYFKEVIVEANSREEAAKIANENHMFDDVTLELGDIEVSEKI